MITDPVAPEELESSVADGSVKLVPQAVQLKHPDAVIKLAGSATASLVGDYACCLAGILNGDSPRFRRQFWEFPDRPEEWVFQQTTVDRTQHFGGRDGVIYFDEANGHLREHVEIRRERLHDSDRRGNAAWGKMGIAISQMSSLPASLYNGNKFDASTAVILPNDPTTVPALWCFCSSPGFTVQVRQVNQKVSVENGYFEKLPFDLAHWQRVAAEKYPSGLPEPHSNDPTQWLFHGHPAKADTATILQVAVARLAGYRWPAELDETMRLAPEARTWVSKCKDLAPFADDDGVVPIVPTRGEPAAEGRVRDLLRAALGGEWSGAKEATLLAAANADKAPADKLDDWLKNRFFAEHCSLFHNRPFVWHIWDGRKKDGFGVLVHYHRLAAPNGEGRRLLEKITHGYLGDWIARQRDEMKANKAGADARLASALDLQKKLEAILAGEPPYDIFVRWKPLQEQPIGWEPDINDGVRINIRPFIEAGVLRDQVNVKWAKDRGQEPQTLRPKADFPWFWSGSTFSGDRVNDVHLSVAQKQKAREAKGVQ